MMTNNKTKTQAEIFGNRLQRNYFLEQTELNLPDYKYTTVDEVAKAVLPPAVYIQWKRDHIKEVNELRDKYNLKGHFDLEGNLSE